MEYLNLKLETLGDIRYVGSTPVLRATWLNLQAYCAKQENSGVILNCRSWGDGTWAQIAGLKKREVHAESALWEWVGNDLHVWAYNRDSELKVKEKRERGRNGGLKSGQSRRSTIGEPAGEAAASPAAEPAASLPLERKERKGKEKECNERESTGAGVRTVEIEAIATAYCRQDSPLDVREAIRSALDAGTSYEDMRRGVNACMEHIRRAPGGASNQYVPKALTFFQQQQWRSPEAFQERWKKEARNGHAALRLENEIPTKAKTEHLPRL